MQREGSGWCSVAARERSDANCITPRLGARENTRGAGRLARPALFARRALLGAVESQMELQATARRKCSLKLEIEQRRARGPTVNGIGVMECVLWYSVELQAWLATLTAIVLI
jgi:hypothetical protein